MDLQSHHLIGAASPRWAKIVALLCFALTCGLLLGSLVKPHAANAASSPLAAKHAGPQH
jgi:hypothetical protein